MPEMQLNLIKGDKMGSETDYRDALPINMSAVLRPIFDANGYMIQEPGLTAFGTASGIDRGGLWNERFSEHFRVSGGDFIAVDANGNTTVLGAVSGIDTVSLPYSFNTQGIIASYRFYLFDPVGGFREVVDPDLGDPIDGVWIDGYYFMTDGEFLFHTNIDDEESIDPLKFATAEFSPDPTLGVGKTQDDKAIAFGRYSCEFFANDASENFAFTRLPSRALKIGIVGTHCKTEAEGVWFILGGKKEESVSFHTISVGGSQNISTREVDKIIGQYNEQELSTVVVESRQEDGYTSIIINLPNEVLKFNYTIAKSVGSEQAWSILQSENNSKWRGIHGLFEPRIGRWIYGDKRGPTLALLDETVATHYGNIAGWSLYTPYVYLEDASINEFEVEIIPGFTTDDDATVFLSLTYDGVIHSAEKTMTYGLPSDYNNRFIAYRLGYIRNWFSLRLRGASRSRMAFARAKIDYS